MPACQHVAGCAWCSLTRTCILLFWRYFFLCDVIACTDGTDDRLDFTRFIEFKPNDDVVELLGHLATESVILIITEAKLLQAAWSAAATSKKKAKKRDAGAGVGGGRANGVGVGVEAGSDESGIGNNGVGGAEDSVVRAGVLDRAANEKDSNGHYIGEEAVLEVSRRHERASEPMSLFRGGRVATPATFS